MMQVIDANWLALGMVLVIGLLVAWWIFSRATRPKPRQHRPDVLDEGVAPAQRNQALIDAPAAAASSNIANAAASFAATGPDMMVGLGEVAAAAIVEEIQAAEASPAPAPAPTSPLPAPEIVGEADDLRRIKGVGPKLVALLHGLGVTRYSQIAAWTDEDIAKIDAQLGTFAGRITRDSWVEQAKFLAAGDTAGFEGKFGKL
jgi:predicted flap endonuclease-1-like 5' DNA nuclease